MILTNTQIKDIILNRPNKAIWEVARDMNKKLAMHVLGAGLDSYVEKITDYEDEKAIKTRKKYARSNQDLFERILRPVDNIWEARGGSVMYRLPKEQEQAFRTLLQNVENGYSVRKWIKSFCFPRYIDDPMGVTFIEVSADPFNPEPYPTYKSSQDIYEGLPAGRNLEYLVLKTDDPVILRVIDDAFDYLVKKDGDKVEIQSKKKLLNTFMRVPALINSDIPKDGIENLFASPVQRLVELADEFLIDGSVRRVYKFKHGFPKEWVVASACDSCMGTKFIDGKECPTCKGTGLKASYRPDDMMIVTPPDKDNPEMSEKGGHIAPDLDFLKWSTDDLKGLENVMFFTHWGTHQANDDQKQETATGRFLDVQPVKSRLNGYSEWEEATEQFITDLMGEFFFQQKYQGCSINIGRRYLIEEPDAIWEKYLDARSKGAPINELNDLLLEYIETKNKGNSFQLQKAVKLMQFEPQVHLTISQCKGLLPFQDFNCKLYYQEFISTLNDIQIIDTPLITLRQDLINYVSAKKIPEPLPIKATERITV